MDLLKYLKSKISGSSLSVDAKERSYGESLQFKKTYRFGFPSQPSCIAVDEHLGLMAIGTSTGLLSIYGRLGVQLNHETESRFAFLNLFFLPKQGRLVAFREDQSFNLFELNNTDGSISVDVTKSCSSVGKLKQISSLCFGFYNGTVCIFVGAESGNVYSLDTNTFEIIDRIIYQEAIAPKIPDDYRLNPGAIEALAAHPADPNKLLLGFNRGLIVQWDFGSSTVVRTFVASLKVESLCWHDTDEKFYSSHSDGSYITWHLKESLLASSMDTRTPFGPFPCKSITKIYSRSFSSGDDEYLIFVGGMPRAVYADRHALSVQTSQKQVAFDFTTDILDFVVVGFPGESSIGEPEALLVLCKEEVVAIDFRTENWPCWRLPYLHPFNASLITACICVTDVPATILNQLVAAGLYKTGKGPLFSDRKWPLGGGHCANDSPPYLDLMITGHEDGSVKFWHGSLPAFPMLFSINSAVMFDGYVDLNASDTDEPDEWPPLRRVGCFDPFTDDVRFTVNRILFDSDSGSLLVGGAAGQLSMWCLSEDKVECALKVHEVHLVEKQHDFEWKGHDPLQLRVDSISCEPGYRLGSLLQCLPPASISSVAMNINWGLIAFGTAHGFAVFDFKSSQVLLQKCLLSVSEISPTVAVSETTISRYKSFKKSLRESFRRKRKPRFAASITESDKKTLVRNDDSVSPPQRRRLGSDNLEPVERAIEARSEMKQLSSLVRFICFANTNLVAGSASSPSLWIGTNGGMVIAYMLKVPDDESRQKGNSQVACILAREIHLRHGAPVISVYFVENARSNVSDHLDSQKIIVCTEEQIKSFSLPLLKPLRQKYRLTALEGSRVIKTQMALLDGLKMENQKRFLIVLTNLGWIMVFDVSTLKPILSAQCIPSYCHIGIYSTVLSGHGEGYFLLSSSEWQRFTVFATQWVRVECSLDLPVSSQNGAIENSTKLEVDALVEDMTLNDSDKVNISCPSDTQNASGDSICDYLVQSNLDQTELDKSAVSIEIIQHIEN